ncbi:MAG TPA: DUF6600 domain-containing protein [Thermoanaerobaculia bacterium]
MKNTRNILFALLLLSSVAGAASASTSVAAGIHIGPSGRATVDLGFFYDDLAPYGNWIERPSYGWVWTPRAVSTSWRPYEDGHWVWTDEGWVWVTDEPYGWATYHYGRWYDDPEIGWAWVPGDEWGPSWVSWQAGGDYVGWAPLPPGVNVSVSVGGGYGGYAYGIAPEDYVFVPERDFLAPRIATYVVPETRVRGFWGQTRNFTNYRFSGGRVFNQGIPVDQVQRFVGRRVPRYQVADLGTDFKRYRGGARIQGNRLALFRPQVQKAARVAPPIQRAAARRAVVSAAQFKAAHPQRVAFAQRQARLDRQQVRQQRAEARGGAPALNPRGKALQQRQTRLDQRQAKIARQQVRTDRVQQRQAQSLRQQQKLQRQTRVDQRQAQVDRQRVRVDRAQQRQAQSFRQQQKLQQRQARVDQRQARVDRQRVQIDRAQQRQAQAARQQQARAQRQQFQASRQQQRAQRQAMQQQRAAQRQGGGGRGQGQGNGGHRGHGRPPGR